MGFRLTAAAAGRRSVDDENTTVESRPVPGSTPRGYLIEKDSDQIGASPPARRLAAKLAGRPVHRTRRRIGSRRRHGVVGVDDAENLGEQRNGVAAQSIGIAAAVQPLVMMADDRPHATQEPHLPTEAIADHG